MLALLAAILTFFSARGGLAFALVVPVLPLGNIALGLALLYGGRRRGLVPPPRARAARGLRVHPRPAARPARPARLPAAARSSRCARLATSAAGAGRLCSTAALVAGLADAPLPFAAGRIDRSDWTGRAARARLQRRPPRADRPSRRSRSRRWRSRLRPPLPFAAAAGLGDRGLRRRGDRARTVLAAPRATRCPPCWPRGRRASALALWPTRAAGFARACRGFAACRPRLIAPESALPRRGPVDRSARNRAEDRVASSRASSAAPSARTSSRSSSRASSPRRWTTTGRSRSRACTSRTSTRSTSRRPTASSSGLRGARSRRAAGLPRRARPP